ncbi:SulP family inorganic anion transporter [Microbacterium sp. Leaf320]|uniref:SulP family inorganic anion transporter n=1 Tax=Microbacterium sp. Leaf320 TaxID=1736334 RepID=UPI0006F9F337|nr:SulP family inorganic anion transporter [Microbacterium sp. Leaf320]KQQ65345.1 hypothetical protein ASF63_15500 [Microbacterium sp. Leaf320]
MRDALRPLRGVRLRTIGREVLAGVTLLAISVPLNIGYAQIAGLPATAGLYALVVPTLVYVLLVSSRQVVVSPDAAAAALVFSSLAGLGVGGDDVGSMAAGQALVCGALLVVASVLRWGFLASFLSHPILVGFVGGLALEVLLSQVRKMLGLPRGDGHGFFVDLVDTVVNVRTASVLSLLLSGAALLVLVVGRRFFPRVPTALVVLIAGTAVTAGFGWDQQGVAVLGDVLAGPPAFAFPDLSIGQWVSLLPSACALALITMAEGVLLSRSYGDAHGYRTDANRDVLGFGAANMAAGVSMSFAVGSSTSRTAAMDEAGSRTQLPSVVLAVGATLLLLVGTDVLAQMPSPVIGAVVAVAVWKLVGVRELRELAGISRYEFGISVVCLVSVLVCGPLHGLIIAFVLSLVNLARRAAAPRIEVSASVPVVVVRSVGPVFFANAATVADRIRAAGRAVGVSAVVWDVESVSDVDVTGARALSRTFEDLAGSRVSVAVAGITPDLAARFTQLSLGDGTRTFPSVREARATLEAEIREGVGR